VNQCNTGTVARISTKEAEGIRLGSNGKILPVKDLKYGTIGAIWGVFPKISILCR
jgi:hypothetical protein